MCTNHQALKTKVLATFQTCLSLRKIRADPSVLLRILSGLQKFEKRVADAIGSRTTAMAPALKSNQGIPAEEKRCRPALFIPFGGQRLETFLRHPTGLSKIMETQSTSGAESPIMRKKEDEIDTRR
jgi:hypothetical protein